MIMSISEVQAKWYLYELVDTSTNTPFYVGKGQGNRIDVHEREAAMGVCSKKCNKIRSLQNKSVAIERRKLAYFWDEQAAYDAETDLIQEYGLSSLTNIMPGGQRAFSRRIKERKSRYPSPGLTPQTAIDCIEKHAGQFAYWLKWFEAGKLKCIVTFDTQNASYKIKKLLLEAFWNSIAPKIFIKAASELGNIPKLQDIFRPYGINLTFSEATNGG